MKLHEYQAKSLFKQYGIPIPQGQVANSPEEARAIAQSLGSGPWVVKAQVHSGGRGKAGGVQLLSSLDEVEQFSRSLIGQRLYTAQSGAAGLPVQQVLVEQAYEIAQEFYISLLLDRAQSRLLLMASKAGGMDIEQVAAEQPEQILTRHIHPAAGLQAYQARYLGFQLGLQGEAFKTFSRLLFALYQLYLDKDLSLIEINPLILTTAGELIALDAKINIDDNALFRQPELKALQDPSQEDSRELIAAEHQLNYIALDGEIGCMVNGAGLAMATMDLIQLHGGQPANFLDVGGGTTAERVKEAFKLILSDEQVRSVWVNIFGGIVRCDLIAEGIISAARDLDIQVPVIVRLQGTKAEEGLSLLSQSGLNFQTEADFDRAAQKAVAAAREEA